MSLFNRRSFLVLSAASLSACGFTPAYSPGGGGAGLQDAIEIDAPTTRPDYLLTRHLEDRLGRSTNPRYGLSYSIDLSEAPIAISANNVTTRYNVLGEITYALRDLQSGIVLSSGKVDSFTSYSTSGTTVATQASEKDAQERLMVILGDQIVTRLLAAASKLPA
ncbi:MAG: LPS assembly lipoprotein LptE [Roseovarius sp.]